MAIDYRDIQTRSWSMNVVSYGEIVADVEDVKQCIGLILLTQKGSVPGLADFGCGLYDYIDKPTNVAGPLMVREIRNAITLWEPRVTVRSVTYKVLGSQLLFNMEVVPVFFRVTDSLSSVFVDFTVDYNTGAIYLTDAFGNLIVTQFGPIKVKF